MAEDADDDVAEDADDDVADDSDEASAVDTEDPTGTNNPFGEVVGNWEAVIEDMHATAEDYREAGRETVELHPGDVMVLREESDREGLDVVVPGDEFEDLLAVVDDHEFSSYEVFRRDAGSVVYALVVIESDDGEAAVFVPTYYQVDDLERLVGRETVYTHVRPLSQEEIVTFTHENPGPFVPDSFGEE